MCNLVKQLAFSVLGQDNNMLQLEICYTNNVEV
jgi:hypothetical protein